MNRLINRCQTGFITERNIMDGVMVLHDTRIKNKESLVLKLDFEKGYNKNNWDFLLSCLSQRGFHKHWCDWIATVMTSGTLSVKVNNTFGLLYYWERGETRWPLFTKLLIGLVPELLWQTEPAQGPCCTVACEQCQIRLHWFGLLGKK